MYRSINTPGDNNVGRLDLTNNTPQLADDNRSAGIVVAGHIADDLTVSA
jgi:hypothetical protein